MRIGVIGAGMIGGTLVRRWASLGHQVTVANSRGPESLAALAAETGARAGTIREAVQHAEVVVVTIPMKAIPDLPKDLFAGVPESVVVIDTNNYYPFRDVSLPEIDGGEIEAAWVARHLGRPVVKVFNNIGFKSLLERGLPAGAPGRVALPVAADREADRVIVHRLVDELGFDPVSSGTIADSWRQQPGTPAYTQDLTAEKLTAALAAADPSRVAAVRKAANDQVVAMFAARQQQQQ